ncbi:MAG TPA: DUF2298 domain-containing protein [Anaerolineae bacterium]|nr:DUF2298 domain-containing protein [Anaerolineae bacterium]
MGSLAAWWLALSVLGWVAWPLVASVFGQLPSKGYGYTRTFGLLLLSYLHWLLCTVGLLPNDARSIWALTLLIGAAGCVGWVRKRAELVDHLRREWRQVLMVEVLFALMFLVYALHKSYDPAIDHTEEPMDFAFLNGILRSPGMPPRDPWLSGFAISYYYFGYLTVSLLVRLTGLPAGVGYNLGLTQTLALTVTGAYTLICDLIRCHGGGRRGYALPATVFGLVGGIGLAISGNLEGVVELLWTRGFGSRAFYRWLDVPGLTAAPRSNSWLPSGGSWWWRASRIIVDHNILGKTPTVITEFPAFSFILGDLHPHVMSLPYVLMALGLACELFLAGQRKLTRHWLAQPRFWAIPLVLGVLGFVNTFDLPTFVAIVALAAFSGRWQGPSSWRGWGKECLLLGLWITMGCIAIYLPFYLGLSSQVQGIGLAYYAKTPLKHYLLCFGTWLLPIAVDITPRCVRAGQESRPVVSWRALAGIWLVILLLPWIGTGIVGGWGRLLLGLVSAVSTGPWLLLLQSALMALLLARMWSHLRQDRASRDAGQLLSDGLALAGVGLTYATEFYYLRDSFDTRMNTVFKLHYQAWLLLAVAATLAAFRLWRAAGWRRLAVWLSGFLLCASIYYPVAAAYTKTEGYGGQPTLDGTAFLQRESPAEYGAYLWLSEHAQPKDVLVEAVGEEYVAAHNRLSSWSGVPTILGWPGHEVQWRGDDGEVLRRAADLERIFVSADQDEIMAILRQYGATYLHVGPHEREKHAIDQSRLAWYASFLETVYSEDGVTLYRVPGD